MHPSFLFAAVATTIITAIQSATACDPQAVVDTDGRIFGNSFKLILEDAVIKSIHWWLLLAQCVGEFTIKPISEPVLDRQWLQETRVRLELNI